MEGGVGREKPASLYEGDLRMPLKVNLKFKIVFVPTVSQGKETRL